jgi:hypothetical protein
VRSRPTNGRISITTTTDEHAGRRRWPVRGNTLLKQPDREGGRRANGRGRADGETEHPLPRSTGEHAIWINGTKVSHLGQGSERHVMRRQLHANDERHSIRRIPLAQRRESQSQLDLVAELFAKRSCGGHQCHAVRIMSWSRRATSGAWPPQTAPAFTPGNLRIIR